MYGFVCVVHGKREQVSTTIRGKHLRRGHMRLGYQSVAFDTNHNAIRHTYNKWPSHALK